MTKIHCKEFVLRAVRLYLGHGMFASKILAKVWKKSCAELVPATTNCSTMDNGLPHVGPENLAFIHIDIIQGHPERIRK